MVALETKAVRALGATVHLTPALGATMAEEKATVEAILATDWFKMKVEMKFNGAEAGRRRFDKPIQLVVFSVSSSQQPGSITRNLHSRTRTLKNKIQTLQRMQNIQENKSNLTIVASLRHPAAGKLHCPKLHRTLRGPFKN